MFVYGAEALLDQSRKTKNIFEKLIAKTVSIHVNKLQSENNFSLTLSFHQV